MTIPADQPNRDQQSAPSAPDPGSVNLSDEEARARLRRLAWPADPVASQEAPPDESRRAYFRLIAALPADLWLPGDSDEPARQLPALLEDLSGGGAQVRTLDSLPVEKLLEIRFELPLERAVWPIHVKGRVTWTKSRHEIRLNRSGIEFLQLDEATRRRIVRFIFSEQTRRRRSRII